MSKQYDHKKVNIEKLGEIQELAMSYHDRLIQDPNGEHVREWGGLLIWGDHYAVSKKILFGINPANSEEGKFFVEPLEINGPWDPRIDIKSRYCQSCNYFFGKDDYLNKWISDATSTFLVPWGTKGKDELKSLKQWNDIYRYSSAITRKIVEHHRTLEPLEERLIVILAGPSCMEIFSEFFDIKDIKAKIEWEMPVEVGNRIYANNNQFQWGKVVINQMAVYQVPHFSYGTTSIEGLRDCAKWLSEEIHSKININV